MGAISAPGASPKLLPAGKRALFYPDHLSRWRAKLAQARYDQASIICFGDSITKGQNSHNAGTTDEATWRVRGWVPQLRSLFADRYGDPGEGIISLNDVRVVNSGGQTITSVGIAQAGKRLDNGDTLTISLPACTRFDILWWWESDAATEPFTYTIDGGAADTATSASGSDQYPIESVDSLSDETHEVVITGPATGHADISAIAAYTDLTTGVAVHRVAESGGYLDNIFAAGSGTSATRINKLSFVQPDVDLAIIAFGTNEGGAGQALSKTPATFKTILTDVTDFATDNGVDCLLIGANDRDHSALTGPYYPEDFFAAAKQVAAANAHVAYLDIQRVWGDYATANAAGLMRDTVHPNLLGHSDMAKLVFEAIGGV